MTYRVSRSTAADRRIGSPLEFGEIGAVSDEAELFFGSPDTPIARAVAAPQLPRDGVDVRRLWVASNQGQSDTWTDVDSVAQDSSGIFISPKPNASSGTDIMATGVILANELVDGGTVEIEAVGTYQCGSILPRILANLSIGGTYVRPQYEPMMDVTGATAAPTDIAAGLAGADVDSRAFEWSSSTCGPNALAGYEALWVDAANMTQGEFQWRLTMRMHALGRYAKWQRADDDSALSDRNCWVEATLEWGALKYNAGGRMGTPFGYYNTAQVRNLQYHSAMPSGTVRGAVYTFMGQQWLCHAGSPTTALNTGVDPNEIDPTVWLQMLSEEAPGIGMHWRDFFVPIVSKATISGFATVDWTADNQIQLELGGPQQVDLGTAVSAYTNTTAYIPEGVMTSEGGAERYVAKCFIYQALAPHFVADISDVTTGTPSFTFAPTGASPDSERCWRLLPATLRDTMRMQMTQAYLFGGRKGTAQKRLR